MTWNHQGVFFPSRLSEWTSHLQPILTWRLQPHEFCVCAAVRLICWAPACVAFISLCVCLCVSVSHLWGTDYKGISTFFLTPNWSFFFFFFPTSRWQHGSFTPLELPAEMIFCCIRKHTTESPQSSFYRSLKRSFFWVFVLSSNLSSYLDILRWNILRYAVLFSTETNIIGNTQSGTD